MVLMGLLTRHAGFSRACWHVFCACFWLQPVSGASVQRLNRASCVEPKTSRAHVRLCCHHWCSHGGSTKLR
ncbi:hypothetical protein M441DRAFT_416739 [Trichoderma asperellum CBS 433.97]|uniref:Secreted protein n=1 Tax=Trichoderma asperellum (strain ATCC 204424 / CBS 433.97 / NBRC 101777) TaxID=1042311 RepID=A0A2T3Z8B4_TRIA4|nr:hypothetical protein M441DRAFT_416739 [Trichoderma asperellum CBS 433.97]PTB41054.1 hypothetical protein M441DRAFT_416739 [Trichoderma asperellum CBS 433.97]